MAGQGIQDGGEAKMNETERIAEITVRRFFDTYLNEVFPEQLAAAIAGLSNHAVWRLVISAGGAWAGIGSMVPRPAAMQTMRASLRIHLVLIVARARQGSTRGNRVQRSAPPVQIEHAAQTTQVDPAGCRRPGPSPRSVRRR